MGPVDHPGTGSMVWDPRAHVSFIPVSSSGHLILGAVVVRVARQETFLGSLEFSVILHDGHTAAGPPRLLLA